MLTQVLQNSVVIWSMHLLQGGIYIFQLADWYFASFALLVGSALEAIGICWCYGLYTYLPSFISIISIKVQYRTYLA